MQKSNEPTKTKKAMKKTMRFLSMAALALVGALMTGCSSDDDAVQQPANTGNVETLTLTVSLDGGGTRALSNEGVKTFAAGDQIAVVYKNKSGNTVKTVSDALTEGGSSATFTVTVEDADKTKDATYIYPAAMANTDGSVNYDALETQDGTLATLGSSLDLATYTGAWSGASLPSNVDLENQLAILELTLKDSDGSSEITSTITGMTVSDGTNTYTVTRSAAAGPIYVAIQPTSSANIEVTATDGTVNYTKSLTGKTYAAGIMYPLGWRMAAVPSLPAGALAGKFTISNDGGTTTSQVYFSQGNLQATYNGSAWSWAFAANQWDYIGNAAGNTSVNGNGSVSAASTVDLFGWVGASSTWTGAAQYGISNSTTLNSTDTYGNVADEALKSDWGTLAITNGGNTTNSGWRMLTFDEWQYLLITRMVNGGTGAGKSYTLGQSVNSKLGLVIYPDNYTGSEYSGSDWATFEAAGCVFLPAAGRRNYESTEKVEYVGSRGFYWSSSPYTGNVRYAYDVYISSSSLNASSACTNRNYGLSVRLVRPVE